MMGVDALGIAAHRGNIGRYKGLLRTHLTEFERAFVYRRLEEEKCALASLIRKRRVRLCEPMVRRLRLQARTAQAGARYRVHRRCRRRPSIVRAN
jgi:hypothetical protein